jgi:hypothetical protein
MYTYRNNYRKFRRNYVLDIRCVFHVSLQFFPNIICSNKYLAHYKLVKLEISSGSHGCLQVKCPLLLSYLSCSWNGSTNFV